MKSNVVGIWIESNALDCVSVTVDGIDDRSFIWLPYTNLQYKFSSGWKLDHTIFFFFLIFTFVSAEPDAINAPSGDHLAEYTASVCP